MVHSKNNTLPWLIPSHEKQNNNGTNEPDLYAAITQRKIFIIGCFHAHSINKVVMLKFLGSEKYRRDNRPMHFILIGISILIIVIAVILYFG